jgi:hypothetical protein
MLYDIVDGFKLGLKGQARLKNDHKTQHVWHLLLLHVRSSHVA